MEDGGLDALIDQFLDFLLELNLILLNDGVAFDLFLVGVLILPDANEQDAPFSVEQATDGLENVEVVVRLRVVIVLPVDDVHALGLVDDLSVVEGSSAADQDVLQVLVLLVVMVGLLLLGLLYSCLLQC
jgi:hypothetical protein